MNFLKPFYSRISELKFSISADQGSAFAKTVAGDFNPIHHAASKRFCVPGDLLFAIALNEYGLHQYMTFQFLDIVSADIILDYPKQPSAQSETQLQVVNDYGKPVLGVEYTGGVTHQPDQIEQFLKNYVSFSGQNFPHILVPLMREHQVMINPKRPLVIYQSMSFEFDHLNFNALDISLEKTTLEVNGRRGDAKLYFSLNSKGCSIGAGIKKLILSGLREYDQQVIQKMCDDYLVSKTD
jgi:hypothetical protein